MPVALFSSFELDSPATRASMPSASDGFCRFEKGSSSVFEEPDRDSWSSSPNGCTPGSCDHVVPRLPSVWKLPSGAVAVSAGNGCCVCGSNCDCDSYTRFFFRSRRPPRLLPPSTHSRLSRLHRRHGIELSESLQSHVRSHIECARIQAYVCVASKPLHAAFDNVHAQTSITKRAPYRRRAQTNKRPSITYSKHRLFLFLQFRHAICVLLIFEASSSSWLADACAPAGCCGAFASMPHLEAIGRVGV
jgi:hypothetical protein